MKELLATRDKLDQTRVDLLDKIAAEARFSTPAEDDFLRRSAATLAKIDASISHRINEALREAVEPGCTFQRDEVGIGPRGFAVAPDQNVPHDVVLAAVAVILRALGDIGARLYANLDVPGSYVVLLADDTSGRIVDHTI